MAEKADVSYDKHKDFLVCLAVHKPKHHDQPPRYSSRSTLFNVTEQPTTELPLL